ncbi:MAG: SAM-dependent methyltransferase [Planctomycetota bacterium]|nr:SAM-dependent methyltransferase [Planctomycetota bacterium]
MSTEFVSRGGQKLRHALDIFRIDPRGYVCADLGASTGGFTDCLLQAGAAKVIAVDTAYGELAWRLRNDPRVAVLERTNALHATPTEAVDLVVMDLGWTPQRLAIPAAVKWLKRGAQGHGETPGEGAGASGAGGGRIISLVKPHYEMKDQKRPLPPGGVLEDALAEDVAMSAIASLPALGVRVLGQTRSPLLGGSKGKGNAEWLVLVEPA